MSNDERLGLVTRGRENGVTHPLSVLLGQLYCEDWAKVHRN